VSLRTFAVCFDVKVGKRSPQRQSASFVAFLAAAANRPAKMWRTSVDLEQPTMCAASSSVTPSTGPMPHDDSRGGSDGPRLRRRLWAGNRRRPGLS